MKSNLAQKIIRFLSGKRVTLAIILLAVAGRILQLVYFFNIRLDASHQVIATKNLLAGHGISMDKVFANDLSATVYEPLINWPPGYSILLAPFLVLFGGDYVAAGLTLSILAAVGLILISRKILQLLQVPVYLVNLWTLTGGFFIYFFYFIACSDAIAIFFAMTAVYYCLSLLKNPVNTRWKTAGMIAALILCGAMKYLFMPVVFIIPAWLLLRGIAEKRKNLWQPGITGIVVLSIVLGGLLLWQKSISGAATYISEPGRGFFPQHLLAFFPFVPGSFIKPDTIAIALQTTDAQGSLLMIFFQCIHVAALSAFTWIMFRHLSQKRLKGLSPENDFNSLLLLFSWVTTLLLAFLSLGVEKETWDSGHLWTYIEEHRYYGLPIVMIQMALFAAFRLFSEKPKVCRLILVTLFVLLHVETVRGIIFNLNRVSRISREEYSWQYELRLQRYADAIIKQSLKKEPVLKVVVAGPRNYINHRVSLYSNAPILELKNVVPAAVSLETKEKTLVVIILEEKDRETWSPLVAAGNNELAGQFNGLYFYTVYVSPR